MHGDDSMMHESKHSHTKTILFSKSQIPNHKMIWVSVITKKVNKQKVFFTMFARIQMTYL